MKLEDFPFLFNVFDVVIGNTFMFSSLYIPKIGEKR